MKTHPITLLFEDGRSRRIEAGEAETVYAAALRHRIRLVTDCLEGACATCKARCTRGDFVLRDYSDEALSADEAKQGYTLTCQMLPRSECVVELPYGSGRVVLDEEPAEHGGVVAAVERVSSTVVRLDIETGTESAAEGSRPAFLPGQYVHIRIPGTTAWRSYSFANPAAQPGPLRFYIKLLEGGVMSEYARDRARAGDAIRLDGPYGHFYLREPRRPILMVAGGTGLAPMLSMLDELAKQGGSDQPSDPSHPIHPIHPIHLLYGANAPDEFFAQAQLAAYAQRGLRFTHELVALHGDGAWRGASGHVTEHLRPGLIHGGDCDAYLCGPPVMIEAAQAWLQAAGLAAQSIHAERFVAS
ncbi:MAG: 2Fe-2S iron-sulfur cluster binding domain-containing protein [Betaproteobacteria bacterium]|nr:2Fe-2S iron-sulfur cluster binding domain-containing protein [Betaproteobacteria bacterium]